MRIFIGYDPKEALAFHVLAHSIMKRASCPVSIHPVIGDAIEAFTRPRDDSQATDFSFSRFMVPYLMKYRGFCVFMDCDMLCRVDVASLKPYMTDDFAVKVCKHKYIPKSERKMQGQYQKAYPKKNWSSFMLIAAHNCKALSPEYVNQAEPHQLHQFHWLPSDRDIGDLGLEWNWLVDEYPYNSRAKFAHFTLGGPWWKEYEDVDYADEWRRERNEILNAS